MKDGNEGYLAAARQDPFPAIARGQLADPCRVNVGYRCNQSCRGIATVNAGPNRNRGNGSARRSYLVMTFLEAAAASPTLDITGGAPSSIGIPPLGDRRARPGP
jgi:hypothetical protein